MIWLHVISSSLDMLLLLLVGFFRYLYELVRVSTFNPIAKHYEVAGRTPSLAALVTSVIDIHDRSNLITNHFFPWTTAFVADTVHLSY